MSEDLEDQVSRSLLDRDYLLSMTYQVDLPEGGLVHFMYLSGDKLYTA